MAGATFCAEFCGFPALGASLFSGETMDKSHPEGTRIRPPHDAGKRRIQPSTPFADTPPMPESTPDYMTRSPTLWPSNARPIPPPGQPEIEDSQSGLIVAIALLAYVIFFTIGAILPSVFGPPSPNASSAATSQP